MECLGDSEHRRSAPIRVGRGVAIVVVATGMVVVVVTNIEVEVEEAGAELAVPVPVAGGVKTETANADDGHQADDRSGQAEETKNDSAKATHVKTPVRF